MILIPVVLVIGGFFALVLYLDKRAHRSRNDPAQVAAQTSTLSATLRLRGRANTVSETTKLGLAVP
jgi:hypothetical protein